MFVDDVNDGATTTVAVLSAALHFCNRSRRWWWWRCAITVAGSSVSPVAEVAQVKMQLSLIRLRRRTSNISKHMTLRHTINRLCEFRVVTHKNISSIKSHKFLQFAFFAIFFFSLFSSSSSTVVQLTPSTPTYFFCQLLWFSDFFFPLLLLLCAAPVCHLSHSHSWARVVQCFDRRFEVQILCVAKRKKWNVFS